MNYTKGYRPFLTFLWAALHYFTLHYLILNSSAIICGLGMVMASSRSVSPLAKSLSFQLDCVVRKHGGMVGRKDERINGWMEFITCHMSPGDIRRRA